jgi:hypothetical protein
MTERQALRAGSYSTNIQASGDVLVGLSYEDVRQVCMNLYDRNVEQLLAEAGSRAERRAEEVTDSFLSKAVIAAPDLLQNLSEPGVQRALLQAQIGHATFGNAGDVELYGNLLVERLTNPAKNMVSVACQQAIVAIGELTTEQIDLLTCLMLLHRVSETDISSISELQNAYATTVPLFSYALSSHEGTLRYLQSVSCLDLDGTRSYLTWKIIRGWHPQLFGSTFGSAELPPALFAATEPWRTEIREGSDRWQVVTTLSREALESRTPGFVFDEESNSALIHVNECRSYTDEQMLHLVSGDNAEVRRAFEMIEEGSGVLKSCIVSNRGAAIAYANLKRRGVDVESLNDWIEW